MNKKIIFDASAFLALLQNEKGSEQVEKHLSNSIISSVNLSEVVTVLTHAGILEQEAIMMTRDIISEIIPFDENQAYLAAFLRKDTRKLGLSFGDRACLALGQTYKTTVITADKIWGKLCLPSVQIEIIR